MNKNIIISFVLGIVVILSGYFVWSVIQTQNQVAIDTQVLQQVVNVINASSTQK